jgi:hypothetical protein
MTDPPRNYSQKEIIQELLNTIQSLSERTAAAPNSAAAGNFSEAIQSLADAVRLLRS